MFTVRDLVYIGVFGALWGAMEITIGSYLHILRIPLTGTIMTALGLTVALVGRSLVPRRGSVFFIGVVAALLKMFSLGGIIINPMLAILIEAGLAELVLGVFRRPGRLAFGLAGAVAVTWDFFHPFFTQGVLAGVGVFTIYERTLTQGSRLLGIGVEAAIAIIVALLLLRVIVGTLVGLLAWQLALAVGRRTGPARFPAGSDAVAGAREE